MQHPEAVHAPPAGSLDHQHALTDLANARRFVAQHGENVRYVRGGGWLIWDERRWQHVSREDVEGLAKQTADQIWSEIPRVQDTGQRAKLAHHAQRSASD